MGCVIHFLFLEIASLVFVSFQSCPEMVSLVSAPPAADAFIIPKYSGETCGRDMGCFPACDFQDGRNQPAWAAPHPRAER